MSGPVLDVVIPVHDEQHTLAPCVHRLHSHLAQTYPYPFRITVADNASTDATLEVAARLARELPTVRVVRPAPTALGSGREPAHRHTDPAHRHTASAHADDQAP